MARFRGLSGTYREPCMSDNIGQERIQDVGKASLGKTRDETTGHKCKNHGPRTSRTQSAGADTRI